MIGLRAAMTVGGLLVIFLILVLIAVLIGRL